MEKRFQGPEKVKKEGLGMEKGVKEWRWRCGGAKGGVCAKAELGKDDF
jgi:hypothetical protein